jgi:outer membrane immunogenic protein
LEKLLAGLTVAVLMAGSAKAADLPVKAPVYKAPLSTAVYNWTGFYVGANAGYSWGDWKPSSNFPVFDGTTNFFPPNSIFATNWDCASFGPFCSTKANVQGALGGAQAGYNWQSDRLLLGIEGDIQATAQKRSENGTTIYTGIGTATCDSTAGSNPCRVTVSNRWDLPWIATLRGRLGFVSDHWLFYATGGLAVGEARSSFTFTENQGANVALTVPSSGAKLGYTLGVGVEAALGNNWSVKAEYLFVDLGSRSVSAANSTGFGPIVFNQSFNIRDNIVRAGINYRFGSGPVVARY